MTPDWGPAIAQVRADFQQRGTFREPFRSVSAADMRWAMKHAPRFRLSQERPPNKFYMLWWLAAWASQERSHPRPEEAPYQEVMRRCGVGERAAYRLLEKHATKDSTGRFVLDTTTRAMILHDVTTRALRQRVAESRKPTTARERRSAQEYARRHIPAIRPVPLTGRPLLEAFLSLESASAFPGRVTQRTAKLLPNRQSAGDKRGR